MNYISMDARALIRLLAIYSLGFILVAMLLSYYLTNYEPALARIIYTEGLSKKTLILLILSYILYLGGFCTLTLMVNKLIRKRDVMRDENSETIFSAIKKEIPEDLKTYVLNFLIMYGLYYTISFVLGYFSHPYLFIDSNDSDPDPFSYSLELLIMYLPTVIILPVFLYLGFSALFVSCRDNIGSTEALKDVYKRSRNKLKKIWLCSVLIVFIAVVGEAIIAASFRYLSYFIISFISYNSSLFIYIKILEKLFSLGILVFIQVGAILLYGSVEDELEGHYIQKKIDELS